MVRQYLVLAATTLIASQAVADGVVSKKYSDIKIFMHELATAHPNTTRSVIIGASDSGDTIEGVAIGNGPIHNLVVATHHGNEYGSTEVAKAFAASLADTPIANQTIFVVPVLNIYGYNTQQREERDARGRSRDPNRDYPGPCGSEGPHRLKSTASLAKFIQQEDIITTATLHTYSPAVVYPWGFSTDDVNTPYDELYKAMAYNATEMSHYTVGNSAEVIYPANGCYEDYAFWKNGAWSLLFELGHSHYPSQAEIKEMIRVNVPGLRKMFENAPVTKAENHDFSGQCSKRLMAHRLDRHDE